MEKKMKIFLMMIGLMGLVFVNACDDGGWPPKIPWTCINAGVDCPDGYIRDDGFPNDDGNTNDLLNDEMEDDEGLNPDPGTDPGVDAEQDPGSDDSGNDPGNQTCAEGERRIEDIDGVKNICLPIATADALEYLYNDGEGRYFERNGTQKEIYIFEKNHFKDPENRCQGDDINFIIQDPFVLGIICIHNSLALSLCKEDASPCGGPYDYFVKEGEISLSEGLYDIKLTLRCSYEDTTICPEKGEDVSYQEVPQE